MGRRKAASMPDRSAATQQGPTALPEVLDLVISATLDASLLCKCTVVSSYFRDLAVTQVRNNLPQLLRHTIRQAAEAGATTTQAGHHQQLPQLLLNALQQAGAGADKDAVSEAKGDASGAPVHWLCATAGKAVIAQPQVASALLSPGMVVLEMQPSAHGGALASRTWLWKGCTPELAKGGLRLTDQLVATVARQHLPAVRFLVEELQKVKKAPDKHGGLSKLYAAVVTNQQDCGLWKLTPNRNTGMRLDATMMVDLMFIACNEGSHHVMPTLLECDETYTKLLTEPGPGPVAVRMADDLARDQHSSQQEDLAQAPSPLPPHAQQQQQQRHAVASEQQPAHLVDQLLMTCLAADHVHLLQIAVNAPAARRLGAANVAKLMHAAALRGNRPSPLGDWYRGTWVTALDVLAKLPAAQEVPAGSICCVIRTLLHAGLHTPHSIDMRHFLKLPGVNNMSSSQFCGLLLLAVRKQLRHAVQKLVGLAYGQHLTSELQHDDVMHLLTTLFIELGSGPFVDVLGWLQYLQYSQHLTAEDVMLLLTKIASGFSRYSQSELVKEAMNLLGYSHITVTDPAVYRQFLQALVKGTFEEYLDETMDAITAATNMPVLGLDEYLKLLHYCVVHRMLPGAITAMPAAQEVAVADVWELLQLSFVNRPRLTPSPGRGDDDLEYDNSKACPWLVRDLAALPAMQQLTADQIAWVLQQALQHDGSGIHEMLALPAARRMDAAAAHQLVLTAFFKGGHTSKEYLKELCEKVPACAAAWEDLDPQLLQQHLESALGQGKLKDSAALASLLQHPKLQQHVAELLPTVLLAGFHCYQKPGTFFECYGGAAKVDEGYHGMQLCMSLQEVETLLAHPAAARLSASVVQTLMRCSIKRMDGVLLQELVGLPAAARVGNAEVVALLQLAVQKGRSYCLRGAHMSDTVAGIAAELAGVAVQQQHGQSQPLRQETDAAAADMVGLVHTLLDQAKGAMYLFPLLQLPWARQLPAAVVRTLLQSAAERQARPTFDHLMQLPQAPRGDAEVQGWSDALQVSCGPAVLADLQEAGWDDQGGSDSGEVWEAGLAGVGDVPDVSGWGAGPEAEPDGSMDDDTAEY